MQGKCQEVDFALLRVRIVSVKGGMMMMMMLLEEVLSSLFTQWKEDVF